MTKHSDSSHGVSGNAQTRAREIREHVEHRLMAYFSSDGERYKPVMDCTCGFDTGRCDSFAEAGEMVDEHLALLEAR